jgi:hypothetical protein
VQRQPASAKRNEQCNQQTYFHCGGKSNVAYKDLRSLLDARENFSAADGSIECCNLDGSNRRLLVGNGDIVTAKQLVLNAEGGLLYWCDREGMREMRSRTDGREVTTLVRTGLIPEDQKRLSLDRG